MSTIRLLLASLTTAWFMATAPSEAAQSPDTDDDAAAAGIESAPPPLVDGSTGEELPEDDGSRVAVLGYHEFSSTKPPTAMRIRTSTFRKQMEAIKNLGLPVISLEDFIAWKNGEKDLGPRAILITIDDGWKSVYTEAYPILKEFQFPFVLYLYTNYVDGGGRALSSDMIREMMQHGASIGSHSVSHPFPATIKRQARKGPDAYARFLNREFGDSKAFLDERFGRPVTTCAYAGGYMTDDMIPFAHEAGYEFLFTVKPGKIRRDSPNQTLPRYIVLGNSDRHFELATSFQAAPGSAAVPGAVVQTTEHPVAPEPGSMIASRLPTITADLSRVEGLDPESLVMRVSGFGRVDARYNPATSHYSWTVIRPLRHRMCEVNVQWCLAGSSDYQPPMRWSFLIEREAAYQPGFE